MVTIYLSDVYRDRMRGHIFQVGKSRGGRKLLMWEGGKVAGLEFKTPKQLSLIL